MCHPTSNNKSSITGRMSKLSDNLSSSLVSVEKGSHHRQEEEGETFEKAMHIMGSSPFEHMSVATPETASTTPSSRGSHSASPQDAMVYGLNDYNESWPSLPQHHYPTQWNNLEYFEVTPSEVQQAPLLLRPEPRKLACPSQLPTLEPMQVEVPFLLNYNDILAYGRPRLPTVMELVDEDAEEEGSCCEEEGGGASAPPRSLYTSSDTEAEYSLEPASHRYAYVDCYQDHRWDLAREDEVLSEAIYYHVLEATTPAPTPVLAPMPVPVEPMESSNLVKPQALRVVCPTTIAPVLRRDGGQDPTSGEPKEYINWYHSYLEAGTEDVSISQGAPRTWLS